MATEIHTALGQKVNDAVAAHDQLLAMVSIPEMAPSWDDSFGPFFAGCFQMM